MLSVPGDALETPAESVSSEIFWFIFMFVYSSPLKLIKYDDMDCPAMFFA